jgi:hypothetical protein
MNKSKQEKWKVAHITIVSSYMYVFRTVIFHIILNQDELQEWGPNVNIKLYLE